MNTAAERNHAIYEDMWSRYELFPHDGWSSWSAIAPFYKPGRTLEIGPGKFPHVPIPGTHFVDLSRVALGALHEHGGLYSPDGTCRPFDAGAAGTVEGSGVATVVLKRLSDALRDGDTIHAVVRGSAINNDGAAKLSYTAPSVDGQRDVIRRAQQAAGLRARDIGFIEAHGTATALGDSVEVAALTQAFRLDTAERGFCALGSIKSNLGHVSAAAGVTGLIKAALALSREVIPPTLHFERPNPTLDLPASPFFVNAAGLPWPRSATPVDSS